MHPSEATPRRAPPHLVDIPGGHFIMGRADRRPDERPPHRVTLPAFRAAVAPVTNAEYDLFLQHTAHEPPPFRHDPRFRNAQQPVVGVSWFDAVAYCHWLGAQTGLRLRLPSEAEREYAAQGAAPPGGPPGGTTPGPDWPWGDTDPAGYAPLAFVAQAQGPHIPQPACANGYGLRCMAENVHEWCAGAYQRRYDAPPDPGAPADPSAIDPKQRRASRGGSWRHRVKFSRVSARSSLRPGFRYNDYGFRVYAMSTLGEA